MEGHLATERRAAQPKAPIVAHGMNNSNDTLPLGRGLAEQKDYIRRTLRPDRLNAPGCGRPAGPVPASIPTATPCRRWPPRGLPTTSTRWISDTISRLRTPDGELVLLPYPTVTVDMGQFLARMKSPNEIETLWLDYVLELASEARADPAREATTVVIGLHPFVVGTPDGAAAMRRVLSPLKKDDAVWLTDTEAMLKAAGLNSTGRVHVGAERWR